MAPQAAGAAKPGAADQQLAAENTRLKRQLAERDEELAILKKGSGVLREKCEVKYAFMLKHAGEFRVTKMAEVLQVLRSGYYDWRKRLGKPSARTLQRIHLDARVKHAFAARERNGAKPEMGRRHNVPVDA